VLLGGLKAHTLSDMAFRRVEARLMEQVEQGLPSARPAWLRWWWLGPVTGAVAALAWVLSSGGVLQGPTPVGPAPVALVANHVSLLTVLQASGGSRVRRGESWGPVKVGEVLAVGEAFTGELRLAPPDDTAWTFEVSGSAAIGGAGSLTLGVGEVRARVSATEATIAAGGLQVIASEAVFLVSSTAAEVLVEVSEGEVSLSEGDVAHRTTLKAPTRVRWAPGSRPVTLPVVGLTVAPAPTKPWLKFDATALPAGTPLVLDGVSLGVSPLSVLVSPGRHRLTVDRGTSVHESWLELAGDYSVNPAVLEEPAHEAPPPDEAAVARVQAELRRQVPKLATCYEKWLKENPSAVGDVELHLVVNEKGRVKRAEVVGSGLSRVSADCLVRTARGLQLPPLGTEVELELPIKLTTTH
jgi:hypothetical protein